MCGQCLAYVEPSMHNISQLAMDKDAISVYSWLGMQAYMVKFQSIFVKNPMNH